jgi:hypothetical protein
MFKVSSIYVSTAGNHHYELIMKDTPDAEIHYKKLKTLLKEKGASNSASV